MRVAAPPKFKVLVANLSGSSDPARNTGGNPVKLRTGFVLQMLHTPDGNVRTGGPTQQPPPVSAVDNMARIQVLAPDYWDPTVAPPRSLLLPRRVPYVRSVPDGGDRLRRRRR